MLIAYKGLGDVYSKQGKDDLAVRFYQKAIAINPKNAEARRKLGIIYRAQGKTYRAQGKYGLAIGFYQKAIAIDPENAWHHYRLACVYSIQGRKALSIESLRKAISLDKDCIGMAKREVGFYNIRESPEFQALIRSVR